MAKQLLFYDRVVPVSKKRHAGWSIEQGKTYGFASEANSVPLMTVEFQAAAADYPIVFSRHQETLTPIVVLGIESNASLYVDKNGNWAAGYIPAFIRRYPFVFSSSDDGKTFTLCIDETFEGCDKAGKLGERLFTDNGERTPFLDRMLDFTNKYQAEHRRTAEFGKLLLDLDLVEPMQAEVKLPTGDLRSVTGFVAVTRERLKKIPAERLGSLLTNDALELIYLHLYSMRNFEALLRRVSTSRADHRPAGRTNGSQPQEAASAPA